MDRVRVASVQYFLRPVEDYSEFETQVRGHVRTAADYGCRLIVFPEYFTLQLLSLGDVDRPMDQQVRWLASNWSPRVLETMRGMARESGLYISAGSTPVMDVDDADRVYNDAWFIAPDGNYGRQGKLHMTRFEKQHWRVSPRQRLRVFDTELGKLAIAICYDVEFPEIARAAAHQGALILLVSSYTDHRQSFMRVRYCAHARAIENQMYVVHSATVGSLPNVPGVSLAYGQAALLCPSDYAFGRDGILAEGNPSLETMVVGELNLRTLRSNRARGSVLPLRDSKRTSEILATTDMMSLPPATP